MLSHVYFLAFLLTVLFCRLVRSEIIYRLSLVRSYANLELEVDPPKVHGHKNVLRITIDQIKCCCALIILLTKLILIILYYYTVLSNCPATNSRIVWPGIGSESRERIIAALD